ncbi:class II fructose-bisphosphate aldolase [uncultured Megasphaera sp.]|uniref:class II fructose-bisphosphate aldolase n=1 Tax=uncultured Megasphaera sp. TaxID=165188 RepID=UPI0028693F1A|nr:class II fructose-bisphosphate aldolase [uncultured Megasphaera sp.]
MLINLQTMLASAARKGIAVGAFNIYNVESLQAVLAATRPSQHAVILSFGEKYDRHMPLEAMAELVRFYCLSSAQPVVLHLDHSQDETTIIRAVRAGFTSVMYDGSRLPVRENAYRTAWVAKLAHAVDVGVEGELGYLNEENGQGVVKGADTYTQVEDAVAFAAASQADALAVAVGNAHGIYRGTPQLDFQRLLNIARSVTIPLVLHGSSGIPKEALQKAIRLGIRKVNLNTEISTSGVRAARDFLARHQEANTRFEEVAKAAEQAMTQSAAAYLPWLDLTE